MPHFFVHKAVHGKATNQPFVETGFDGAAELPRLQVENPIVSYSTTHTVKASGGDYDNLQDAVNHVISSHNGSENHKIVADVGIYDQTVDVSNKTSDGWLDVVPSDLASLPYGVRVNSAQTDHMYTIRRLSAAAAQCITGVGQVQHVRFIGAEIYQRNYLVGGAYIANQSATSSSQEPNHVIFDRCYIHGDPVDGNSNLLGLHGRYLAAMNCQFEDMWRLADQQRSAIGAIRGTGPYLIDNNGFDRCAGITVFFGGGGMDYYGQLPQDITITRNYFTRPLAWNPDDPLYENLEHDFRHHLEMKCGVRVLIEGNLFENHWCFGGYSPIGILAKDGGFETWMNTGNYDASTHQFSWTGAQTLPSWANSGTVLIKQPEAGGNWKAGVYTFTSKVNSQCVVLSSSATTDDQDSTTGGYFGVAWSPWVGVDDLTFRYNIIRHSYNGLALSFGTASNDLGNADGPTRRLARCSVHDILFDDTPCQYDGSVAHPGGSSYHITFGSHYGPDDFRCEHNTGFTKYPAKLLGGVRYAQDVAPDPLFGRLWFRNNLLPTGSGTPIILGDGAFGYVGSDLLAHIKAVGGDLSWNRNLWMGGPWPINGYAESTYWTGAQTRQDTEGQDGTYFNDTNDPKDQYGDWIFDGGADPTGTVDGYKVNSNCDYHGVATDGKDLGVDIDTLKAKTAGTVSGSW